MVIGKICIYCERPRYNTKFWDEFTKFKKEMKRQRENTKGSRFSPRMFSRTKCDNCGSKNVKFRKLKVNLGDTQSYEVTCKECGKKKRQAWKSYSDLEKLHWAPKRPIK